MSEDGFEAFELEKNGDFHSSFHDMAEKDRKWMFDRKNCILSISDWNDKNDVDKYTVLVPDAQHLILVNADTAVLYKWIK